VVNAQNFEKEGKKIFRLKIADAGK